MATITATPEDPCVVLPGVGWDGYESALRLRGDRRSPKMVYHDGNLRQMSPATIHERLAERLSDLVKEVAFVCDLPCDSSRSTTFRRQKDQGGAEADASFYLANAHRIAGKSDLDLRQDPPPDLVIEAVNTHAADASVEVWRRFGVPEVWVCDESSLRILTLRAGGTYAEVAQSLAFPGLTASEIHLQIMLDPETPDSVWRKQLRRWANAR
jgi:Uma2 family endonuclease